MAEDKAKKVVDPQAVAKNWEDRLKIEADAPHKWNENWGELFDNGVPHDYGERIKYLQNEISKMPKGKILPKYGVGESFKEVGMKDKNFRRQKMFQAEVFEEDA